MNFGIARGGRVAANARSNQGNPLGIVIGRGTFGGFPFGQNNERGTVHVEFGVHAAGTLFAARQSQAHVRSVPHSIGG